MSSNMKFYRALFCVAFAFTGCSFPATNGNPSNSVGIERSSQSGVPTPEKTEVRVPLGDGRVSFIPPANLKPLTKEQIASSKYPKNSPPQHVFSNDSQTVSVAVTFNVMPLAPEQLPEYKEASERLLSRIIPNVRWFAREIVEINGRKWVHMEVESDAPDYDLHNHQYTTSFDGAALMIGFNSTYKEYPRVKDAFIKSAQTIEVKD